MEGKIAIRQKDCLHPREERVWAAPKENPMGGVIMKWKCFLCEFVGEECRNTAVYNTHLNARFKYEPRRTG